MAGDWGGLIGSGYIGSSFFLDKLAKVLEGIFREWVAATLPPLLMLCLDEDLIRLLDAVTG